MQRFSLSVASLILTISCLLGAPSARADSIIYSNVTNFSGEGYPYGGAADQAGNGITPMAADDITTAAGTAGFVIDGFTFSVVNFNSTAVSARAIVTFYANNGAGGGPGTLLDTLTFNPISFSADVTSLFTYDPGTALFTVPASGTFWAGITFDNNNGATGATIAQLNELGQGIFAPPTIGSSQDEFFQSSAAGDLGSNPTGGFFFFGGNPVADFGWQFSSSSSVPEPSSLILSSVAGLIILAAGLVTRPKAKGVR